MNTLKHFEELGAETYGEIAICRTPLHPMSRHEMRYHLEDHGCDYTEFESVLLDVDGEPIPSAPADFFGWLGY